MRTHLLRIVLVAAILPLALTGLWLARASVRSGERLLTTQLDSSLNNVVRSIAARWEYRRGDLLFLAENEVARRIVDRRGASASDSVFLNDLVARLARTIPSIAYFDEAHRLVYRQDDPLASALDATRGTWSISLPVPSESGTGRMDAFVQLDAILPADSARLLLPGSQYSIRDRTTGAVLKPISLLSGFPTEAAITIGDETWLSRTRSMDTPPFDVAVAGPVAPYVEPFRRAAALGLAALVLTTLVATALTTLLTHRLTASVRSLDQAAHAVAGGDLSRTATPTGPAELQRLAISFNTMTESVRRLMTEVSERRALAAVGQFAAELSHEVRNALTSIQIDLERVEERTEDEKNQRLLARAHSHVRRLDAAVTGSLRIARSGHSEPCEFDLGDILRAAVASVESSFDASGAQVSVNSIEPAVIVRGDRDALLQLYLNVLLNSQQAVSSGGSAVVTLSRSDGFAVTSITDTGSGMTQEQAARAADPFFTTREKGTGLGLPIAHQIARAHGGDIEIRSSPGMGTTVEIRVPCALAE